MGDTPGVVYLHGFASGPQSEKARFFGAKLREAGVHVDVPDLNEGGFEGLTLSRCAEHAEAALERIGASKRGAYLIGSSMGGYTAALVASRDPRVRAAVLLAPAFDVPARWAVWLGEEKLGEWRRTRKLAVDHHAYGRKAEVGFSLYLDAMGLPPYPVARCPTLILHGVNDEQIPIGTSRKYAERVPGVRLVELDTDHGMLDQKPAIWEHTREFLGI